MVTCWIKLTTTKESSAFLEKTFYRELWIFRIFPLCSKLCQINLITYQTTITNLIFSFSISYNYIIQRGSFAYHTFIKSMHLLEHYHPQTPQTPLSLRDSFVYSFGYYSMSRMIWSDGIPFNGQLIYMWVDTNFENHFSPNLHFICHSAFWIPQIPFAFEFEHEWLNVNLATVCHQIY